MKEERQIWLVTHNGTPKHCVWAKVKTEDEEPDSALKSWAAALNPNQLVGSGWDATITNWRRVPALAYFNVMAKSEANPSLVSRDLTVGGCTMNLDDSGKISLDSESSTPDITVNNLETLVTLVEALGTNIDFTEKTTLKKIRVYVNTPGDSLAGGSVDSGIYREATTDALAVRQDS